MRRWLFILLSLFLCTAVHAEEEINVAEIIFEHVGDEYEWHITEWKGKPIAIPLPCIVIEDGVHVFTLHHAE